MLTLVLCHFSTAKISFLKLFMFFFSINIILRWKKNSCCHLKFSKFCYCDRNCEVVIVILYLILESMPQNNHIPCGMPFLLTVRSLEVYVSAKCFILFYITLYIVQLIWSPLSTGAQVLVSFTLRELCPRTGLNGKQ